MANKTIAIAEWLFMLCILVASLPPSRRARGQSIFGEGMARPFHQLFVAVTFTLTLRSLFLPDQRFGNQGADLGGVLIYVYYAWVAVESLLMSFLKLCMPYILQCHLSTVINIAPGRNLQMWLFLVLAMDAVAVLLSAHVSPNFWSIKRLGDGLMAIPRIKTLQSYQRVMAVRSNQPSLLVDMLMRIEICLFVAILGASAAYATESHSAAADPNEDWLVAIKIMSIFLGYTALMVHALLLNCLDEGYNRSCSMPEETRGEEGDVEYEVGDTSDLLVPVVRKF